MTSTYKLEGGQARILMQFNHRTPEELPERITFKHRYESSGEKTYNIILWNKDNVKLSCLASADLGIIHIDGNSKSEPLAKIKLEGIFGFRFN